MGTLGKDIKSFIDTRKAGPGELNLHCVGPHGKTAYCELNDHQDGTFTLHLKPQVYIYISRGLLCFIEYTKIIP